MTRRCSNTSSTAHRSRSSNYLKTTMNITHKSILKYIKNHKILSGFAVFFAVGLFYMYIAGTISYPYIMADRQLQSLRLCTFGDHSTFDAKEFGFTLAVPEGYCVFPNRQYPSDGSYQLIPKGFYFSFNEYAFGTVAEASRGYIMTEELNQRRSTEGVLAAFMGGRFIDDGFIATSTNKNGLLVTRVNHVADVFYTGFYDWVLVDHPNGKYFLSGYVPANVDHAVFDSMVDHIKISE